MILWPRAGRSCAHSICPCSCHIFFILRNWASKFPSGARKAPKVSWAWLAANLFIVFLVPVISLRSKSPELSWREAYLHEFPIACWSICKAVVGQLLRDDCNMSVSSTKAYPTNCTYLLDNGKMNLHPYPLFLSIFNRGVLMTAHIAGPAPLPCPIP